MENIKEINQNQSKLKQEKNDLIKKYPFNGRSKYLIDKFLILGYKPEQIQKLLILNKEKPKNLINFARKIKFEESQNSYNIDKSSKNSTKKLNIDELPILLNEISNDYSKKLPDIDLINNMLFPNKIKFYAKAYYNKLEAQSRATTQESIFSQKSKSTQNNFEEDSNINNGKYGCETVNTNISSKEHDDEDDLHIMKSKQYNMIFSYNPQEGTNSKKSINGFAYVFYKKQKEKLIIEDVSISFYTPVTFCIISEFPYFNSYYKLCQQIIQLFKEKQIGIPLEVILYNIINLTLSPINGDVLLNIEPINFPTGKTIVHSVNPIPKKKEFPIIKEENENDDNDDNNDSEFVLLKEEESSNQKTDKNDEEEEEGISIIQLKAVGEEETVNNKSPQFNKSKTLKSNLDRKKKKVKFQKSTSHNIEDNDLEKNISISPDLSKKKRKLKLDNNQRITLGFGGVLNIGQTETENNINKNLFNKKYCSNYEDLKFTNLSGYPLIQYNLSKVLLNALSPQDVLIIFFYSFLEKDILFFSKDLEYLSFTINSYLNLNFPLNDEKYYFFNASVSYDNFINDNSPFVGATFTTILGINSPYNSDYLNYLNKTKLNDHLAVDLDNGVIYPVENPNDKEINVRNKAIFDFIKKICKKEIKDDKGVILIREIKILFEKLESYKNNDSIGNMSHSSTNLLNLKNDRFIDYNDNGQNSIKNKNRNIQEGFYRLINYICIYFYQNLSLKSDDDKEDLNKIIINRKRKGLNTETMNIIFHKDYNTEENNYIKEEIYFLDELMETMKFESFVYGFIQSYNPIDLYKIPLTFTEEFISILTRKNYMTNQNINFFTLIDSLYKKNGVEKTYIDFNPFSAEYYKRLKYIFDREIYDQNNFNCLKKKVRDKYLYAVLSQKKEGNVIDNLKYKEFILDNNLLIKYIRFLKNLKKEEYYHMFHLASTLDQNKIKNISITEIENDIEKYSNNLEISSKRDICCSNIILLFILSIKSIKDYIDCQSFLSAIFQNFTVFRKYYTMIMNLVYRLMNECLNKKDYKNAQNYFFCYYSCINSVRSLKLVPNENLMNIILKFDKIDFNEILAKVNENPEKLNEKEIKSENDALFNGISIKESNQTKYVYVIYNFIKNSFIKEDAIIQKTNELKGNKTLKLNIVSKEGAEKVIEPKIKFKNKVFEYQCLVSTQDKILEDLNKQYELYIIDLDEDKLNIQILFESCLNIILFTRNTDFFRDIDDIIDTFKVIFNVYLEKFYVIKKKHENDDSNISENDKENPK